MSKLDRFKARAARWGQSITVYAWQSDPSGDFVDDASGYPDPESGDYPVTVPEPTYADGVTVKGFVQPATTREGGEVFVKTSWGEEVQVALRAFVPGDQDVGEKDKVTVSGVNYWAARIQVFQDGAEVVHREVALVQMV